MRSYLFRMSVQAVQRGEGEGVLIMEIGDKFMVSINTINKHLNENFNYFSNQYFIDKV